MEEPIEWRETQRVLAFRTKQSFVPLTTESFVFPFGSPEFYEDGKLDFDAGGAVGEVVEGVKGRDRLVVMNNADGTSFAPSVILRKVSGITG